MFLREDIICESVTIQKWRRDLEEKGRQKGFRKGRKEGRQEGVNEGSVNEARRFLKMFLQNMFPGADPANEIDLIGDVAKLEELAQLAFRTKDESAVRLAIHQAIRAV
ncbi:MAG: hypothetical protein HYZ37_01605 [Candidatus Solibacter usitatus]|nr:hypothetical protein [Candidatus Solibacter usitatus]